MFYFLFFESEGFRLLTRQINKSLNFYPNRHNLKTIINNKYIELKNEISKFYKDKLINISIDGVVRKHRKFLGVNAHIIHDGQFHTLNLGIVQLYLVASASYLETTIWNLLFKSGLD